ncbi:MAG TPA: MBOAT family O-acyltransferase [Anaerolineales bacterium]|nr:MBOAT family O-acyltransferase [Anaerolineales bacterium]
MVILVWIVIQRNQMGSRAHLKADLPLLIGAVIFVGATRYFGNLCCLTATRPPPIQQILIAIATFGFASVLLRLITKKNTLSLALVGILILLIFIVMKSETFSLRASYALRSLMGQDPSLATPQDLPWLGFSYLAFRLLHTIRDAQGGKLNNFTLGEFTTYVLFFPALTAGPIDRSQRFVEDLRSPVSDLNRSTWIGLQRILYGMFKKFALADSLAIFSLNSQNASQVNAPFWMWVLLYMYSLRLYFDFSGYTDIALGLGSIAGINLPENFKAPYLKSNLTTFWNSWHITLANWFRAYFFNPLTRYLRGSTHKFPIWQIVLVGQVTTMLLIGLWHGITWNFIVWGLWHGIGLFVHNRWSEWRRSRAINNEPNLQLKRLETFSGWLITFHYVTLGWVWFAMPGIALSWRVFAVLFGSGNP